MDRAPSLDADPSPTFNPPTHLAQILRERPCRACTPLPDPPHCSGSKWAAADRYSASISASVLVVGVLLILRKAGVIIPAGPGGPYPAPVVLLP